MSASNPEGPNNVAAYCPITPAMIDLEFMYGLVLLCLARNVDAKQLEDPCMKSREDDRDRPAGDEGRRKDGG